MTCPTCGCPSTSWLRVSTVARQFGCTPRTVLRMIERGDIDAVPFGRGWRVDHRSLDDFLRQGTVRGRGRPRHQQSQAL
jgi:excisionase family DNA binding protein